MRDGAPRGFLFSRDAGGGEFYQYYWFDAATGRATLLTDGKSRNGDALWNRSGDAFLYTSTRRNGRDNDLYLGSPAGLGSPVAPASSALPASSAAASSSGAARLVCEVEGFWAPLDWSPDDRQVLVLNYRSVTDSTLHLLDVARGTLRQLNPQPAGAPTIAYGGAVFSADGRGVFLVSDEASEFARLRYLDLATGAQRVVTPGLDWDVDNLERSRDGRMLAFTVNAGGRSELHLLDTQAAPESARRVAGVPVGVVSRLAFSPDGTQLGLTINTPRTPGDIYTLRLADGALERWTESETGGLDPATFVEPELIDYPTFDAVDGKPRRIPAIYYAPRAAAGTAGGAKPAPAPVLVIIHGGPEGQSLTTFSPLVQLLVREMGFAVILPNVRGSTGYGKTYVSLDNGFNREDSVRDIGALLDWIAARPELDAQRVALYGGSYGGYMVLAAMTHYNDRIAAAIDVVGISNFVTFLNNTQDYRRDLRRVEYGDERDPEMRAFLQRISPLTNIARITKPMLVAQGYNDPRVPVSEAEQVVAALAANGAAPWYVLAMDEGHGFAKKNNRDFFQNTLLLFLQRTLLGREAGAE